MCGGGSSSKPQTVTQTSIPEWAKPYAENALASTQKLIYNMGPNNEILGMKPPPQYGGIGASNSRVAGWTGNELKANQLANQQGTQMGGAEAMVPHYDRIRNEVYDIGAASRAAGKYDPNMNFTANYNPGEFAQGSMTDPGTMEKYMSPYMQGVVDINKREALRDFQKQNMANQAQAVQAGAFGGGRDAMVRAEAQRNQGQRLGDIQAQGQQAAWDSALGQYNAEAGRNLAAQQAREQGKQFLTSADFQAQQAREQSRQFGANLGLQGLGQALSAANTYADVTKDEAARRMQYGQQMYDQQMGITDQLARFGGIERAAEQQKIDNAYNDFINAQNYPYKQLGFASDIMHGLPSNNTAVYEAAPSALSQAGGLATAGLAGMGLYNSSRGT